MKKSQWAIIFGEPASHHPAKKAYQKFIGTPVLQGSRSEPGNKEPKLFSLRSEAEEFAKKFVEKYGGRWNVSVEKWNKRVPPNPYQLNNEKIP